MTMLETIISLLFGTLMVLPMLGWVSLEMSQQTTIRDRNITGTSIGRLRTYYVRDVTTATTAWVEGDELATCSAGVKGERTLLVLSHGERRTAYTLVPEDGFSSTLWRVRVRRPPVRPRRADRSGGRHHRCRDRCLVQHRHRARGHRCRAGSRVERPRGRRRTQPPQRPTQHVGG